MADDTNHQMVMISGKSATGKSAAFKNLKNQDRWVYLNCESGKRLPFKNSFITHRIDDPYQVHEAFDHYTRNPAIDGLILDSATFMMDMMETMYIIGSADTQKAWGAFAQFWKTLMLQKAVLFGKPILITGHTLTTYNEATLSNEVAVPVKGSLKNNGLESYFSTVVSTKKVTLKDLEAYPNNMLTIDEEDEMLGYKHVFQTRVTKKTIDERIRSPMGMFTVTETFMNNDAQLLLERLHSFYRD